MGQLRTRSHEGGWPQSEPATSSHPSTRTSSLGTGTQGGATGIADRLRRRESCSTRVRPNYVSLSLPTPIPLSAPPPRSGTRSNNGSRARNRPPRTTRKKVGRTLDAEPPAIQDMGVDHRRAHVPVSQQLLHGPDVIAGLEQVGRE